MNTHFCEVGKKHQEEMPHCEGQFQSYVPEPINNTFFLNPIAEEELMEEINRLISLNACGSDNIGSKVIQLCPRIFSNNLTRIVNISMKNAYIPQNFKLQK